MSSVLQAGAKVVLPPGFRMELLAAKRVMIEHFGLGVVDSLSRVHLVFHPQPAGFSKGRFIRTNFESFAQGSAVRIVHVEGKLPDAEILVRALEYEGTEAYSLVFNNCEHMAYEIATGTARSDQVEKFMKGVKLTAEILIETARIMEAQERERRAKHAVAKVNATAPRRPRKSRRKSRVK